MKTALVHGKREKLTFKTNSEMHTRHFSSIVKKNGLYGADVYSVDKNDQFLVIVATVYGGSTLTKTTTVISTEEYEAILDLHDPYNAYPYHNALMKRLGFN